MSGEQFDSGAVLTRARPVLTFATAVRREASLATEAPPNVRRRLDTPTPSGVSLHEGSARRGALPVIPRIVRESATERGPLVRAGAAVADVLRRTGAGTLVVAALGLATLGSIAGLGMRSLSDGASLASAAPDAPTHAVDATATERLLARAPLATRVDRGGLTPPIDPFEPTPAPLAAAAAPAPAPSPAHAPTPARASSHAPSSAHSAAATAHTLSPSRSASPSTHAPRHVAPRAFAAAHSTHAANRKATSTTALARR
jgi:hypothetical protein